MLVSDLSFQQVQKNFAAHVRDPDAAPRPIDVEPRRMAIYNDLDRDALCNTCEGIEYNKPVLGLTIIKNLTQEGIYYKNGTIFDPEAGKTYKCRLSLDEDNPDILMVRGYISFLYATQYWVRIKS